MKKKYIKVTIGATFCMYRSIEEALQYLDADIYSLLDFSESVEVTFANVELTDEEYKALPDFTGF